MGHEVGHITARHYVRQAAGATAAGIGATLIGILTGSGGLASVADSAGSAMVMGYSRDMELEADTIGTQYLAKLGYDPNAMIDVVRLLKNQELFEIQQARQEGRDARIPRGMFASHPDSDERLKDAVAAAHKVGTSADTRPDGRDVYLQHIKGLPFGPSRAQGVVRGSRFYHADMAFTVAFPTGWSIQNLPAKVVGITPQKDAFLELSAMAVPPNTDPKAFLARNLAGIPLSDAQPLEVNGLPGYTAVAREVPLPWGNRGPARFAVVYYNNLAYVFRGATRLNATMSATDPLFLSSIKTFRRLRDNEFALAEPDRIELVTATPQTRIAELAKDSPIRKYPAEQLRLLNDLYPDKEPIPGQTVKVVD
jgi:predicted Zn-dependent protease